MEHLPFHLPGRFWRGNLHTHSTRSDGGLTPEAVCQLYRENGYHFIALTDHFMARYEFPLVDTRPYRTDDFTTLLGAELHSGSTELGGLWHILAVGLPLDFAATPEEESGPELAQRALAAGAFVAAAHPQWYTLTEADILALGPIHAIEVFNGVAVDHNDRADSWHITDVLLSRGHRYFVYAADDFHGVRQRHDFARGWVYVKSEDLTPEALLAALKAGHFYSSTGPQIFDVRVVPGQEVYVRCSPAERIFVTGKGAASVSAAQPGLMEATLSLANFNSPYCRITVRDAHGGRAWTNPIWLEG
ncbi:CehA/McbA family metallohydrolase [Litorilinea aerophila]|uniref:Phosphotransferase n=1 Tax=Litorilinea aerophila TaxID=1204385 RepID=A0A540VBS9_9CHLR|nr:CehA/McbA family metallohydrolase [Litorilinea aerophila]MCC9077962.1 CehA/McbA family metallohydrolase [Litorilinea aerophila]OUC07790.1 phosphotransferase [Litorilinea aerophila]